MPACTKVVLFTEVNSKLGSPFLRVLSAHPLIDLEAVVTSPEDALCSYFISDKTQVNVETEAKALGVTVKRPRRVSAPEVAESLAQLNPDYFIVANFQQLLKPTLLAVPRVAAINFHPSPLPRYAGLAPFYWMVRHGERQTAVSVIKMDDGIDTGPIIMQRHLATTGYETSLELRTRQENENILMLLDLIPTLVDGSFTYVPQDLSKRTYFGRPTAEDYLLDFREDAITILKKIRAGYRHPGSHFFLEDGTRVVVLSAALANQLEMHLQPTPGQIIHTRESTFISAADAWLRLLTVEVDGIETPASAIEIPGISLATTPTPVAETPALSV